MLGNLRGWEWLIILLIVLLLFGARRLPDLTRSVARSLKIFRTEVKDTRADEPAVPTSTGTSPSTDPTTPAASGTPASGTAASGTAASGTAASGTAGTVPSSTPVVAPEERVAPTSRPISDDDGERPRP